MACSRLCSPPLWVVWGFCGQQQLSTHTNRNLSHLSDLPELIRHLVVDLIRLRPFGIRSAIETVMRPFKTALYRAPGDCFPASRPNPITSLPCALRCGETEMKARTRVAQETSQSAVRAAENSRKPSTSKLSSNCTLSVWTEMLLEKKRRCFAFSKLQYCLC